MKSFSTILYNYSFYSLCITTYLLLYLLLRFSSMSHLSNPNLLFLWPPHHQKILSKPYNNCLLANKFISFVHHPSHPCLALLGSWQRTVPAFQQRLFSGFAILKAVIIIIQTLCESGKFSWEASFQVIYTVEF